jgi:hypothetical protein
MSAWRSQAIMSATEGLLGLVPGRAGATGGDVIGGLAASVVTHRCP